MADTLNPPEILLVKEQHELVADMPIDDCAKRLEQVFKKGFFSVSGKTQVALNDDGGGTFAIRTGNNLMVVWAHGELMQVNNKSTQINFTIGIDPSIVILFLFVIVAGLSLFSGSVLGFVVVGLLLGFFVFIVNNIKHDLIRRITTDLNIIN